MQARISSGRVIDPAQGLDATKDLFIAEGRIVGVGEPPPGFAPERLIDATGLIVCPGLVDLCARMREPGQEHKASIDSESRAAAKGGVTTLCTPPDTDPVVDTPAVVELIHQRGAQSGAARVEVVGALTRNLDGEQLAEMGALGEAGCVGVSNATRPVPSSEIMRRALEYAATFDLTVFVQPEDPWLARDRQVHNGAVSTRLGLGGIPETAETVALARDLLLVEQTGARAHFLHLSTARAVGMIERARERGLPVTADVTAHHLHLSADQVSGFNSDCHVRPPLRTEADRDGLRDGLRRGTIDAICSDHQPHERDARLNPFPATEPGISGLETLLPLSLRLVDEGLLSLSDCIACLSARPARILGRAAGGSLEVGAVADVCVFDPNARWQLRESEMLSRGHNTPFLGSTMCGRVRFTLLAGRVVYESAA